jgi:hypothetical protein
MLGSTVIGGMMKIWAMKQESKAQNQALTLQALSHRAKQVQAARQDTNPRTQWTRRVIALSAIFAIIVWPKFAPLLQVDVVVGWTEFHPGFLWMEGKDVVEWKAMTGLVLTPLDTHLVSAIAGLYFGGSLAGHK